MVQLRDQRFASFYGNTGFSPQEVWDLYIKAVKSGDTDSMLMWFEEAKAKGIDTHALNAAMATNARSAPKKVPMRGRPGRRPASSKTSDDNRSVLAYLAKDLEIFIMQNGIERMAKNIPKDVRRYVKEHKEQGNDESKSWALAWSRFCRKNPDSDHCKQDEYFRGKKS